MNNIKIVYCFLLRYFKNIIFSLLLFIPAPLAAFSLKVVFPAVISEIIHQEYKQKNLDDLDKFMETHSVKDLITAAEQSNLESQRILFFLYYLINDQFTGIFKLKNQKIITVNVEDILRIEALIKNTNTVEAWFVWGICQLKRGNHQEGMLYLNKAKKAGHAISYLAILAFEIKEQKESPTTNKKTQKGNIEKAYQALKQMKRRNIQIPGFDFLMGTILFLKGQDSEAKKRFDKMVKQGHFTSVASLSYIGMIHNRNNKTESAKKYFIEAIERGVTT